MKLYPIPGGKWAGTEADWTREMKAAGLDPKQFANTKTREVPTGKKELMEFLTFFAVDVYRTGSKAPTTVSTPAVDIEALRREHNPDGAAPLPPGHGDAPDTPPVGELGQQLTKDFLAAPIRLQAELAVGLIDRLTK